MQVHPDEAKDAAAAERRRIESLREKYREERDRRLRGYDRYNYPGRALRHYLDDPYVAPGFARDPVAEEVDTVVIGGGFSGMLAAAHLRKTGVRDFRIIEKGGDFGGTWYWNRYPGVACDVESYIYLPLLEELGYVPSEKYAKGSEILAYCGRLASHFALYEKALLQTQVTDVRWDEAASRWIVKTDRGDALRARFAIIGSGPLNRPRLPGIPGIESFKGRSFHTSRWDYGYTGGDSAGGAMDRLKDKRVAVVGTGATGIQCIPRLGRSAAHLYVFQRTPSIVESRDNRPTDPAFVDSLTPGWQAARQANFEAVLGGREMELDLVGDKWSDIWRIKPILREGEDPTAMTIREIMDLTDFRRMEMARARIAEIVEDPETAERLKPYYGRYCKRPCFNDEYLQTFNRPNVTLVDTGGRGIEAIAETGIVVGGVTYEVDCIVYATGFDLGARADRAGGFDLHGRNGVTLGEKWADGVQSVHGICTHGFPNLFIVGGLRHGAQAVNLVYIFHEQARHAARLIRDLLDRRRTYVEVSAEAEARWKAVLDAHSHFDPAYTEACTPGSYNNDGKADANSLFAGFFQGSPSDYFAILAQWREGGIEADARIE